MQSISGGGMADELARKLRANATDAERILWAALRDFKRGGLHFRRQSRIGPYIVDFECRKAKLVVELDGSQHGEADSVVYDEERTAFLSRRGYRVIRFWNHEVIKERTRVVDAIAHVAHSPHPNRASRGSTSPPGR
jgi:very-short-patch-repair endonuclease